MPRILPGPEPDALVIASDEDTPKQILSLPTPEGPTDPDVSSSSSVHENASRLADSTAAIRINEGLLFFPNIILLQILLILLREALVQLLPYW